MDFRQGRRDYLTMDDMVTEVSSVLSSWDSDGWDPDDPDSFDSCFAPGDPDEAEGGPVSNPVSKTSTRRPARSFRRSTAGARPRPARVSRMRKAAITTDGAFGLSSNPVTRRLFLTPSST
jgi:hypothetical protein